MNELSEFDEQRLKEAFELAQKAEGKTLPNPAVGALIWNQGRCLGQGYTQAAGKDHAEVQALKNMLSDIYAEQCGNACLNQ